jgi:hypothetical protein
LVSVAIGGETSVGGAGMVVHLVQMVEVRVMNSVEVETPVSVVVVPS